MFQFSEPREATSFPGPLSSERHWKNLALSLVLLATVAGVVLFLLFVVAPSAGAAGGCGGG
jgi:hypothetical protein